MRKAQAHVQTGHWGFHSASEFPRISPWVTLLPVDQTTPFFFTMQQSQVSTQYLWVLKLRERLVNVGCVVFLLNFEFQETEEHKNGLDWVRLISISLSKRLILESASIKSINYFNKYRRKAFDPSSRRNPRMFLLSWQAELVCISSDMLSTNLCAGLRSAAQWVLFLPGVIYFSSPELCKFIFYVQLHNLFGVNMDINSSLQLSINICLCSRYFKFRIQEGKCSQDWLLSYVPF